jgi:type VI secretion system protein ImpJ
MDAQYREHGEHPAPHCAKSPGFHPEAMFQQMLAAAGGLMTFSDRYKTADLPDYRHNAVGEVFAELDALLRADYEYISQNT